MITSLPVAMGNLRTLPNFWSYPENFARTLRVYTPEAYAREPGRRFPVLYLQDGQNVFHDPASARYETWCANPALEGLVAAGRIEPWILVGIDHGVARFEEYSPWDEPRLSVEGRGQAYGRFFVQFAKPFVDRTYRTLPGPESTAAMGASLGGLVALYMACEYPEVIGRAGGLSPSVMWSESKLFSYWSRHSRRFSKIYLDAGATETVTWAGLFLDYATATRAFYEHLRGLGYAEHEVRLVLEPGGNHHELDWQRRLPEALAWLLR